MPGLSEYLQLDAVALAAGIRQGRFSCAEVTACAIERALQINPAINAIIAENYEAAGAQAQLVDANPALLERSSLAGLPFLIKDLSPVAGLPVTYGSRLFDGYQAASNSAIAQKYLDAGLFILGKTNTPEWGLTLTTEPVANGITRNPWNLDYSTGGSSGGAAAAVAAGIVPAAHATDGGGSIRIPASCCGLVGLKPSRGLAVTENTLGENWSGMSVGHVVSRTVRDSAAFLDLIKVASPGLFPVPPAPASFLTALPGEPGKLRIALQTAHPFNEPIDADCVAAIENAAALCESLGHRVERIERPLDYRPAVRAMAPIIAVHIWQVVSARLAALGQSFSAAELEASTRNIAETGSRVSATQYVEARDALRAVECTMAGFHEDYDVVLSPVLAKVPARLGWLDMNSADLRQYGERFKAYSGYTALYNGTGQPSLSLPLHRTGDGLPVGVMFSAAWGADSLLLQLAAQIEAAQPWPLHAAAG